MKLKVTGSLTKRKGHVYLLQSVYFVLFLCILSIRDKPLKDEKANTKKQESNTYLTTSRYQQTWGERVLSVLFLNPAISTLQTDRYHTQKPNTEQTNSTLASGTCRTTALCGIWKSEMSTSWERHQTV